MRFSPAPLTIHAHSSNADGGSLSDITLIQAGTETLVSLILISGVASA